MVERSPAVGHASPVDVGSEPVTWPLSEASSQRDVFKELRPRRQPKAKASSFYKRFHSFSNIVSNNASSQANAQLTFLSSGPPGQFRYFLAFAENSLNCSRAGLSVQLVSTSATSSCSNMHIGSDFESSLSSSDRKRSLIQVTLEGDDLAFFSKQSTFTCNNRQCPPNNMSTMTTGVSSSSGSTSISATIRRKYDKVALCVKG